MSSKVRCPLASVEQPFRLNVHRNPHSPERQRNFPSKPGTITPSSTGAPAESEVFNREMTQRDDKPSILLHAANRSARKADSGSDSPPGGSSTKWLAENSWTLGSGPMPWWPRRLEVDPDHCRPGSPEFLRAGRRSHRTGGQECMGHGPN